MTCQPHAVLNSDDGQRLFKSTESDDGRMRLRTKSLVRFRAIAASHCESCCSAAGETARVPRHHGDRFPIPLSGVPLLSPLRMRVRRCCSQAGRPFNPQIVRQPWLSRLRRGVGQ
jgi:hypothetical protein